MSQRGTTFTCDSCGKKAKYLSDSWSELTVLDLGGRPYRILHHCLECRSQKQVAS